MSPRHHNPTNSLENSLETEKCKRSGCSMTSIFATLEILSKVIRGNVWRPATIKDTHFSLETMFGKQTPS